MIGIYLSGTGNTKHCMEKLVHGLDKEAMLIPIENQDAAAEVQKHDVIVLGYPVQYSNAPVMVREFIKSLGSVWKGKKVFCVATMGAFSGDGAGCSARLLKKCGAQVIGGLHVRMPDSVCDSKLLKKSLEENQQIVREADIKVEKVIAEIQEGHYPKEGLGFFYHMAGLFGQRLWFYGKTRNYSSQLKISDVCVGCGLCEKNCPMKNIRISKGKAVAGDRCTMCYRCISQCPKKAITLLGKEVTEQCRFEKYSGSEI